MVECAMKSCKKSTTNSNYQKDGISFHRFPKCLKTKQKWIEATRRDDDWSPTNESVICSIHFTDDDFQVMKNGRRLRDSSVPTQNLPVVFSMDSSLRDYVIAEYKLKLQENNTKNSQENDSNMKKESDEAMQDDKKEVPIKKDGTKRKKLFDPLVHKNIKPKRSMKVIQFIENEKIRKRKRRR